MRLSLVARESPSRLLAWLSPVFATLLTLAAGAALFALMGKDPVQGLRVFLFEPIASQRAAGELALKATPLMLCAIGLAVCFRANVWNIGAEGQLIAGAIGGGAIALLATAPSTPACSCRRSCWRPHSAVLPGQRSRRGCATASTRTRSWSA